MIEPAWKYRRPILVGCNYNTIKIRYNQQNFDIHTLRSTRGPHSVHMYARGLIRDNIPQNITWESNKSCTLQSHYQKEDFLL